MKAGSHDGHSARFPVTLTGDADALNDPEKDRVALEIKRLATDRFEHFADNNLVQQPNVRLISDQQTAKQFGIEVPLTAQQLAAIVPLHPVTLLRWAREGKIPHRRLSTRKIVFLPSEINRWLAAGSAVYPADADRAA